MVMNLENKTVGIIGFSRTGSSVANFVLNKGARVKISEKNDSNKIKNMLDDKPFQYELGKNTYKFLSDTDLIIVSPGVDPRQDFFIKLINKGKTIISEIELASRFIKGKIIGITGSNGKSTVTSLVYHILSNSGLKAVLSGNIGFPLIDYVDEETDYYVVELSSFQLEHIVKFKPFISVVLNITPDHLDRYDNFNDYLDAKLNVFKNQDKNDYAILNYDDQRILSYRDRINPKKIYFSLKKEKDIYFKDNYICYKKDKIINNKKIPLLGIHNIENIMASIGVSKILGVENKRIIDAIKSFKGLEHRTEPCGYYNDILFVNDSKATNVDATYKAIKSFNNPIILILGGKDKGGNFKILNKIIKEKVKSVILMGDAKKTIAGQLDSNIETFYADNMSDAVKKSFNIAEPKNVILLSPACASFDMYKNYKQRGRDFKENVKQTIVGENDG